MKSLRVTGVVATLLLVASSPACSDDDAQPGDADNAGGEPSRDSGGGSAEAGAPSSSGMSAGGASATAGAASGGEDALGGGDALGVGGAATGEGGSTAEAGASAGGAAPVVPKPDICEQAINHLTGCGQPRGALEAGQNCMPESLLSQCVVSCLLALPCEQLGDWPTPVENCVATCTGS